MELKKVNNMATKDDISLVKLPEFRIQPILS